MFSSLTYRIGPFSTFHFALSVTNYKYALGSTPLIGDTNPSSQCKCRQVCGRAYHHGHPSLALALPFGAHVDVFLRLGSPISPTMTLRRKPHVLLNLFLDFYPQDSHIYVLSCNTTLHFVDHAFVFNFSFSLLLFSHNLMHSHKSLALHTFPLQFDTCTLGGNIPPSVHILHMFSLQWA
jgi:hypothetical protein